MAPVARNLACIDGGSLVERKAEGPRDVPNIQPTRPASEIAPDDLGRRDSDI
jgi:hypothetical protein